MGLFSFLKGEIKPKVELVPDSATQIQKEAILDEIDGLTNKMRLDSLKNDNENIHDNMEKEIKLMDSYNNFSAENQKGDDLTKTEPHNLN